MQGQQTLFDPVPYIVSIKPGMTVRELAKFIQLRFPELKTDGVYGSLVIRKEEHEAQRVAANSV